MTKTAKETEVCNFFSDDDRLKAVISYVGEPPTALFVVDFYKDDVMIDSRYVNGHSLRFAEDIAENFVSGIITVDPKTWRLQGV